MTLSDLKPGEKAYIVKVKGRGSFRKRIIEMGFIRGRLVTCIQSAPLNDPIIYKILDYEVSLRKSEAALIEIQDKEIQITHNNDTFATTETYKEINNDNSNTINVALVGNPNCGKTTLFNYITGLSERVGNYAGVTVDLKHGTIKYKGYKFLITDLPGTYSLTSYTPEEAFVRDYLMNNYPDIIINVVDASNLERNLYLTTQLIDMDQRIIIALNMYDELQKRGDIFDYNKLGQMLGIPIVPTVGNRGRGVLQLLNEAIEIFEDRHNIYRHIHIYYGQNIETAIEEIQKELKLNKSLLDKYSSRFLALKLLEKDTEIFKIIENCPNYNKIKNIAFTNIRKLEKDFNENTETIISDAKYGFIEGALKETYKKSQNIKKNISKKIDSILINKYLGIPIFFIILWLIFEGTFYLGKYPVQLIEEGVKLTSGFIKNNLPSGIINNLLSDGIINGVGAVLIFLPNILLLFMFISFLEDTGYMARAAFIMDKIMHKIGLHGKSFIPLFMGFGCNVPAIMATKTIESYSDRLVTILINPLMSCSARLPIYVLFTGIFFGKNAGLAIFIIYLTGIILAAVISILLKKFFFKKNEIPFVMELPPYRIPTMRNMFKHMWFKAKQYLKRMSTIILISSIIIWSLSYFPTSLYVNDKIQKIEKILENPNIKDNQKKNLEKTLSYLQKYQIENSYIGQIGKKIEPIMQPLGFDWKISISLITGIAGKEVVISTLSVLFNEKTNDSSSLKDILPKAKNKYGETLFTLPVVAAFLTFVLIYFPCIGVIATIKKETSKWKWSLYVITASLIIAYILSLGFKHLFSIFI